MTECDRSEAMRLLGWLEGFGASVRLLGTLRTQNGDEVVTAEACAEYDETVDRLAELLEEGLPGPSSVR